MAVAIESRGKNAKREPKMLNPAMEFQLEFGVLKSVPKQLAAHARSSHD
jgi:hypothetical protein